MMSPKARSDEQQTNVEEVMTTFLTIFDLYK